LIEFHGQKVTWRNGTPKKTGCIAIINPT